MFFICACCRVLFCVLLFVPHVSLQISLRCSVGFKSGNILVQVSGVKLYSQTLV